MANFGLNAMAYKEIFREYFKLANYTLTSAVTEALVAGLKRF
jgi:hypothetical protein